MKLNNPKRIIDGNSQISIALQSTIYMRHKYCRLYFVHGVTANYVLQRPFATNHDEHCLGY